MLVQQNIDAEGERNTGAAWKAYVFNRHPLATWVTGFTVFMVIYCFVLFPMLESGFGLRMAKTLAILMAVPCAGVLIWLIVDELRSEKQGSGRYLLRSSPGSGANVSNSGDQALEEPTIKNPLAALAAGFSALAQQRRRHKRLIRKAVGVAGKEYLDYYDTFEEYVKKGDLKKAYQKLKILLNPRNYPVAKHALYEVYGQVLEDEAFFPLLKAWFKPLPDEKLFRVALMCLFSDNGEDARICFEKLLTSENVDFGKGLIFALTVHHIAENEGTEEGAWLDLAAQYWREYGRWVLETEPKPSLVKTGNSTPGGWGLFESELLTETIYIRTCKTRRGALQSCRKLYQKKHGPDALREYTPATPLAVLRLEEDWICICKGAPYAQAKAAEREC